MLLKVNLWKLDDWMLKLLWRYTRARTRICTEHRRMRKSWITVCFLIEIYMRNMHKRTCSVSACIIRSVCVDVSYGLYTYKYDVFLYLSAWFVCPRYLRSCTLNASPVSIRHLGLRFGDGYPNWHSEDCVECYRHILQTNLWF